MVQQLDLPVIEQKPLMQTSPPPRLFLLVMPCAFLLCHVVRKLMRLSLSNLNFIKKVLESLEISKI